MCRVELPTPRVRNLAELLERVARELEDSRGLLGADLALELRTRLRWHRQWLEHRLRGEPAERGVPLR